MTLYDLHIHTFLSDCASGNNANPVEYVRAAEKNGLCAIGFSDHAWDESIRGASPWYQKQPFKRLSVVKELLEETDTRIKIFFGAETEYAGGVLGVGEKAAQELDYIIVPHSHTHMRGFVLPEGWDSPQKHAEYLLKSFFELCTHSSRERFFGIAHPFYPVGASKEAAEHIYSFISDQDMTECLCAAAENGVFLELNTSTFSGIELNETEDYFYSRFFYNAKRSGNSFFMGSDKHRVIPFGEPDRFMQIGELIKKLGLEERDFSAALDYISTTP